MFNNAKPLEKMMNYLKRRFSSGDLQNEYDESIMTIPTSSESHNITMTSQTNVNRQPTWETKSSTYTSAPSSPTRSLSFANQFMNVARGVVNQAIQQIPHQPGGTGLTSTFSSSSSTSSPHPYHHNFSSSSMQNKDQHQQISKEKCKLLLVIDDPHTDW